MNTRAPRKSTSVFIDTHALAAAINLDDLHHALALAKFQEFAEQNVRAFTSEWVLAEFLSLASRRPLRNAAVKVVSELRQSSLATIINADQPGWQRTFDLFRSRRDKEWSFVDCSSMILCRDLGVTEVLTHDHHFTQAGFRVLL